MVQSVGVLLFEGKLRSQPQHFSSIFYISFIIGGQFLWPGVRKGFKHTLHGLDTGTAVLETVSLQPLVFEIKNFLTDSECKHIIQMATPGVRLFVG